MWLSFQNLRLLASPRVGFAGGMLLLFAGLAGLVALERYHRTPGDAAPAPVRWPEDTSLVWRSKRVNVVVAVHPRCACTQATLDGLIAQSMMSDDSVHFHFLFLQPSGVEEAWHQGSFWAQMGRSNVTRVVDRDGLLAARFGARTSGALVAYRADGLLAFHGGVTPARGQSGPNVGLTLLTRLVDDGRAVRHATSSFADEAGSPALVPLDDCPRSAPVFGCPLCRRASSKS